MKGKGRGIILKIIVAFLSLLGFLCFFSAKWYIGVYGDVGFDAVLFTLFSGLGGVEFKLVAKYIVFGLAPAVLCTVVFCLLSLYAFPKLVGYINRKRHPESEPRRFAWVSVLQSFVAVLLSVTLIMVAAETVSLTEYIKGLTTETPIYNTVYADPASVQIEFPEKKQNLIFILMESMEMTYTSKEYGGVMDKNLIPELCTLAEDNVNFSSTDTVGGGISAKGSTWTIGAMVSQTAGIPLKLPVTIDANSYGEYSRFLPGATTLSDILHENGYYQALMVGSDAAFGGRSNYYSQHGTDRIYDVYTAKEDGIIGKDYWVWWGMEDLHLYEYSKQALADISSSDKPFAFTMLTVDTHHIGGYRCKYCKSEYPDNYSNVISCADRQLVDFIDWIKTQDFYEDTTIVISGDHPSMDSGYIQAFADENYQRRIYNCFINSLADTKNSKNREFVTMDMFPTILAAIGCDIKGDRLGLGTNLFSDKKTLAEEMGLENLQTELTKASSFYNNNILNNYS